MFFAVPLLVVLANCQPAKNDVRTAFYFWRTTFQLSDYEKNYLEAHKVASLYVRAFDVDVADGETFPLATIKNSTVSSQLATEIIPVVFITNSTFLSLSDSAVNELARNVLKRVQALFPNYAQLQLDCDWTEHSRPRYFRFLEQLKQDLSKHKRLLSCTIRLHQAKYPKHTGVPPVDRGLLMVYNMGKLDDYHETNSIYSQSRAMAYLPFVKNYSLPLDVALPVFSWQVHFRQQHVKHLLSKQNSVQLTDSTRFFRRGARYVVKDEFYENGVNFEAGDELREERMRQQDLLQMAELVARYVKKENRHLVFFDLDESNLKDFDASLCETLAQPFN